MVYEPRIANPAGMVAAWSETDWRTDNMERDYRIERLFARDAEGRIFRTQWRRFAQAFRVAGDRWERVDALPDQADWIGFYDPTLALIEAAHSEV